MNKDETSDGRTEPAPGRGWNLTEEQRQRIFGRSGVLQDADQARDAHTDKEIEAYLNSLTEPDGMPKPVTTPASTSPSETKPEERTNHDRILPDGSLNISPMSMHPRAMSCRQAFDQAFYCQSLGGKFNDIYRYGALQSCSEQWGAFWFCMRTKSLPPEERERQIREHYAAREERKRKEVGSSESVWELRERPVERAFWKDPDAEDDAPIVKG